MKTAEELMAENEELRRFALELAERVYICSGLLSKCAERRTPAANVCGTPAQVDPKPPSEDA